MTAPAIHASATPRRRAKTSLPISVGSLFAISILSIVVLMALFAPWLAPADPTAIQPAQRNRPPGTEIVMRTFQGEPFTLVSRLGTDTLGRDVYSRILHGARVSLIVGLGVAAISVTLGLVIGLFAGYIRWLDGPVMRLMDGLMAIPGVLLAIAMVSLLRFGVLSVILAIVVPEIPRVVRLVRSYVLSIRHEPYVEAAITVGTPTLALMRRHIMPNLVAPLIVQATFICAAAILVEAYLSFLGIGISPETPSWGNIIAESRLIFRLYPHGVFFPGLCLGLTILSVNMLGDQLRDILDPKLAKRS